MAGTAFLYMHVIKKLKMQWGVEVICTVQCFTAQYDVKTPRTLLGCKLYHTYILTPAHAHWNVSLAY